MQRIALLIFFIINVQGISLFAQECEWFSSKLNIQPFTANFLEPKAGFSYLLSKSELRLDIGTSSDVYHYSKDGTTLSFGADLFTFTRLRGEKDFHFPVEAIDYLFGVNAGYKVLNQNDEYGFRFRLSHISAHFVDGQYDHSIDDWRNGNTPRVYSREFIEIFPYYRVDGLRVYAGLTYLFHVTPENIGKGIYQLGFDYYLTSVSGKFFPFIAYDFKLAEIEKFYGNNIVSAGIKFGNYKEKGVSLLFSYYSGKSVHGEYYDLNEDYFTVGLNVDL
ncbi:MAG: DUF1207 domain-containing protein [Ignavibacteriaceae bacterium]